MNCRLFVYTEKKEKKNRYNHLNMKLMRLLLLAALLALIVFSQATPASAINSRTPSLQTKVPRFEPAACMFAVPFGLTEGKDLECGNLVTPQEHAKPDGPTMRLAVAIIKSTRADHSAEPLVMAQGGPGGKTIDTFLYLAISSPIREDRDIVLFDQRGTGYSQPALPCPEINDLMLEMLDERLTTEESNRQYNEAALKCRQRLLDEGADLGAFDSYENAADIENLRAALGYDQINLYGVSYGTLLALHTMARYPEALHSVILDSVVPPSINFIVEAPRTADRAYTQLFEACKADPDCQAAYPGLEQRFSTLVEHLNENPMTIELLDPNTRVRHPALITGDSLVWNLFQLFYVSNFIPAIPGIIGELEKGNSGPLEGALSFIVFDRSVNYGMYYSVTCAEDADFDPSQVSYADIRPEIAKDQIESLKATKALCQAWQAPELGPGADEPVTSDIPTLVMSGRFDPITPPAFGEKAAETLSHSYTVTFPNSGHGVIGTSDCADGMMRAFLQNPGEAPDSTCIATIPAESFVTPGSVVNLPLVTMTIDILGQNPLAVIGLIAFVLAALGLLSAVAIYPLAWFIGLFTRKDLPRPAVPLNARLASWLAVLAAFLLTGFLVLLVVAAGASFVNLNAEMLFGLPESWRWIFILPPVFALLSILLFVISLGAWRGSYWHPWRKLYLTFISLCGLALVFFLGLSGFLTGLIA